MRIAFGTDERTAVTDEMVATLERTGHEVVLRLEDEPWPDVGRRVGEAVGEKFYVEEGFGDWISGCAAQFIHPLRQRAHLSRALR